MVIIWVELMANMSYKFCLGVPLDHNHISWDLKYFWIVIETKVSKLN